MDGVIEYFTKLSNGIDNVQVSDNFQTFTLSFDLHNFSEEFSRDHIQVINNYVNTRDSLELRISVDDGDPYTLTDEKYNNIEIINQLIFDEETIISINIEVHKFKEASTISIYDIDAFTEYICNLELEYLLNAFNNYLDSNGLNKLEIQNSNSNKLLFKSNLLIIGSDINFTTPENSWPTSKNRIIKSRLSNTSPQTFADYDYLPSDFQNTVKHTIRPKIVTVLEKLKIIFAISFISNSSELSGKNNIQFNLIGHKYLKLNANFFNLNTEDIQTFFNIYEWIYWDGDSHDKLELSRNIIGRYFRVLENKWHLSVDCLNAIQSAHAIYLKDNVEKYIETKNKVAEVVTEISVKSKEINQFLISSFKNNNLTLLTYFISLFIFNSLSSNADSKIFNIEKYLITLGFLGISFIYLIITLKQFKNELISNEDYFFSMKKIYDDIFEPRELNKLFSHTHLFDSKNFITNTMRRYTSLWIFEIIILLVLSTILTFFIKI
jgi:hypothetical protein